MKDFCYYTPTKVFFGHDKHKETGDIIKGYGFSKIMLQYGKESIKKNGVYDDIMQSLSKNCIEVIEMGGVEPNPKLSFVRNAVKVAKENNVQMILAVGGGSVIDSSKVTAVGAVTDTDVWQFSSKREIPTAALPVGCVLTISAAGSEMSSSAVISNMDENMKRGYNSDFNRCLFAVCNPELTFTVSKYQTACGIVDIMAHTMERYFSVCPPTELTDSISESLLRSVIHSGKILMKDPRNYDARADIMWASSLSHNDLTGCGRENALAVHQLEHALSGEFDFVAHGAGLSVLFPAWARYVYKANPSRFARFARQVWGVSSADDEEAAFQGIEAMENFFGMLGMPLRLSDFQIDTGSCKRLAELCTFGKTRTVKSFIELDYEAIKEIFESCV